MKKIKELTNLDNNNMLSKLLDMKSPVDREVVKLIKAGELTVCVVDLQEWKCEICGITNDCENKYCWFCEHAK